MAGRLKGKIAVVTAAGQGIGRAIAELFVAEGATVYASDVERAKLDGLARAKKAKLNVLSTRAVEAYAAKVGPVDILVNVAGFVHHGTVLDTSEKNWDFSFDLNVKSMHRTIRAFLPGMLVRAEGKREDLLDHQHLIGRFLHQGPAEPLRLWRQQSGGDWPHQVGRGRFHSRGHSLQRDRPWHIPLALLGGPRGNARQIDR